MPTLAEPALAQGLSKAGYHVLGFEGVLARGCAIEPRALADGLCIRESPIEELELWVDIFVEGFAQPDQQGTRPAESFPKEALRASLRVMATTAIRMIGLDDGVAAAVGCLSLVDGVAFFNGATTLPAHRGRGLQTALIERRLQLADQRGAELACVTTQPGSKSQQNVMRQGFEPIYTRVLMTKSPGLAH
ncbi:GNAT family N-acetyltransferase [Pseudenhygromyxa sp. WMMC2535]|uniref:GNAT family N-acetyltransferase n=1 Tax=Pseudenhygromyxa sp. WMMC2535 TaxID=2712867 RepID=UPI0015567D66|nr:GNAT family N-acetyltransferase [Pseudenhygromyxa sp. WMMC2535]NVB42045.1 GNAT family N-acetyltransferase [Pseudenhygromyxa sp. WMMC2535]